MKYIKTSELPFEPDFNNNEKVYLCKICQGDWTTDESGICTMCQEHLDYNRENKIIDWLDNGEVDDYIKDLGFNTFDEYMDNTEKSYAEEENIEIIDDRSIHPCGDCIYFGDEECMKHMEECNYSDKEILEKMKKEND